MLEKRASNSKSWTTCMTRPAFNARSRQIELVARETESKSWPPTSRCCAAQRRREAQPGDRGRKQGRARCVESREEKGELELDKKVERLLATLADREESSTANAKRRDGATPRKERRPEQRLNAGLAGNAGRQGEVRGGNMRTAGQDGELALQGNAARISKRRSPRSATASELEARLTAAGARERG